MSSTTRKKPRKKTCKPKRPSSVIGTGHPVAMACFKQLINRIVLDLELASLLMDDGSHQPKQLAAISWTLTFACSIAKGLQDRDMLRRCYGSLRAVVTMSAAGNLWNASQGAAIDQAIEIAHTYALEKVQHLPIPATRICMDEANWLANRIFQGIATLEDVQPME